MLVLDWWNGRILMHPHVVQKLMEVYGSEHFEKTIPNMYVDSSGLVTIGIGCKIDSPGEAVQMFKRLRGTKAAAASFKKKVEEEWKRTKALGIGPRIVPHPTLAMSRDEIRKEFEHRADVFENTLKTDAFCRKRLGDIDKWPADAQLGLLGMVWAKGPKGVCQEFREFCKACVDMDFLRAARQSHMKVREQYNRFFRTCFHNAAFTLRAGLPIATLWYPKLKWILLKGENVDWTIFESVL
jgi:hypothetical protein